LLSGLVVAQIALSLALLVTAGLFLRTLRSISQADPGFEQSHVLTASVGLGIAGYSESETWSIRHKLLDRVAVLPGVTTASLTDWVPFNYNRKTANVYPEGYVPQPHESLEMRRADVSEGYFAALGIPVLEGRLFTRDDNKTAPFVAILDQTAANHYWPHQSPIGRRLMIWGHPFTVVGVVKNSKHQRMNEPIEPMIYLSYFQEADGETIIQVQTPGDPESLVPAVQQAVHQIDTRMPVFDVCPLRVTTQMASMFAVMETTFASAFAILALVLAASGIYGVVAYRTQLRTQEIGIRVALGASRADVLRLVLYQGLRLTAAGLALGLAVSFVLTRFLRGTLYGVSASDPFTAACVTALLAVIAVLACYMPALKAMRIDPVTAIRAK
jgi:predicted permease